jgi:hypothetical protein
MTIGIIFVIVGILIIAYPALLSIIVATFLIMIGIALMSMSHYYKKIRKGKDNPFVDFFMRF